MKLSKMKIFLIATGAAITLMIIFIAVWISQLDQRVNRSLASPWFIPPVEIYAKPTTIEQKQRLNIEQLQRELKSLNFRKRSFAKPLFERDYRLGKNEQCASLYEEFDMSLSDDSSCLQLKQSQQTFSLFLEEGQVENFFNGSKEIDTFQFPAKLFAQFYANEPVLRKITPLKDMPFYCLQAVTAIEDHDFLEHEGISLVGIARAVFDLLRTGRVKGGGSTITQQLVKNYYLSSERTLSRKINEMFIAMLLERKVSKEVILENYLNVIYMGQSGPFQVRGFASASEYYFNKSIKQLNLHECALMAGLLNSPGRFNPFKHPERALKRRAKVLNDMAKYKMIDQDSLKESLNRPLPKAKQRIVQTTAPYFVDSIMKDIKNKNLPFDKGLKVYTTLSPRVQKILESVVKQRLPELEKRINNHKELKANGKRLQTAIITVDVATGELLGLIGGNNFKTTQYNRAIDGHRQVGSIMKPIVYLTALENTDSSGERFHPLYLIEDSPFKYKYEGQVWQPKNYSKKYWGNIPMFFALKNSINVSTAKIGIDVGLDNIVEMAHRLGVTSELKPYPSLTLGAFELYPIEVAQAFLTIARMGHYKSINNIYKITTMEDESLFEASQKSESVITEQTVAPLIGMMKQTLLTGTGRWTRKTQFKHHAAGKTGTTSDSKDAWFVGFTPDILTLVWVGYDDNTTLQLTGSSGALPLWLSSMHQILKNNDPEIDFNWPDGVTKIMLYKDEFAELYPQIPEKEHFDFELIYRQENLNKTPIR